MDIKTTLNEILPGKVLLPSSDEYKTANDSYFTFFESDLKPSAIVQPTTTTEISSLVKGLKPLLEKQSIRVAIRGTGHTPFAGSANITDGVTIDLRALKGIRLNVFGGYSDKSLVALRQTSKKFDPEGIFQKAVPGGFKLSRSS